MKERTKIFAWLVASKASAHKCTCIQNALMSYIRGACIRMLKYQNITKET